MKIFCTKMFVLVLLGIIKDFLDIFKVRMKITFMQKNVKTGNFCGIVCIICLLNAFSGSHLLFISSSISV